TAAQEEFLRAVSHDLRAPLRHVTSYGALVREVLADLPPEVQQLADVQEAGRFLITMDLSARRMGLMLDGLLAIERARRALLRPERVVLHDALNDAQAHLAARANVTTQPRTGQASAASIQAVDWQVATDLPSLQADPVWLRELLGQLLGNAIKFSIHAALPCIAVRADAAPPGCIAFTVQDNGVGFDPARAGSLFGVFQRLHREGDFEGVGSGLALCRTIAQRHGGEITVTAQPHGGCTVRVQWPAAAP
ncbi:MAG: two-component sensor histidine kinase, partial [Burkholderiaceae bacterium]|nr:two-component sensor histidine kinase [Burkholderiaceae bacterium]